MCEKTKSWLANLSKTLLYRQLMSYLSYFSRTASSPSTVTLSLASSLLNGGRTRTNTLMDSLWSAMIAEDYLCSTGADLINGRATSFGSSDFHDKIQK